MKDDKARLSALARGVQGLRRQSRELRKEVDFLRAELARREAENLVKRLLNR